MIIKSIHNQGGFTLIEILVVTSILGILVGISTNVFIGILRSQNKTQITNEVRQNAALVIDLFERDVRSAAGVTPTGPTNTVTLSFSSSTDIIWTCVPPSPTINGHITRDDSGVGETLTNTDTVTGVSVICENVNIGGSVVAFDVAGFGIRKLARIGFKMEQGVDAPARNDYKISLPFDTTVGTRLFD